MHLTVIGGNSKPRFISRHAHAYCDSILDGVPKTTRSVVYHIFVVFLCGLLFPSSSFSLMSEAQSALLLRKQLAGKIVCI